jgi:energy-coupling factor transporter ATP-binding protein EcfA2
MPDGKTTLDLRSVLEVHGLWYWYDSGPPVLQDISFSVGRGDFFAIVGPNGSGKTTLAKHFNGLLKPRRGQVKVCGEDTAGRSVGQLARRVGYVFQSPDHQIFAATVGDEVAFGLRNLGFAANEVHQRTEAALTRFGLGEYSDWPPALLGYGLRRKVTLAAVLAMQPEVLVLDEPTTGLDAGATREVMAMVAGAHRAGGTVVLISHDMKRVAQYAQRVGVLNDGRLLALVPPRDLFQDQALLVEAHLTPPPITRLAQGLRAAGMRGDSLTVDEFCDEYVGLASARHT